MTLNIKYRAELGCQEYKQELESLNNQLKKFEDDYKPLLQRLQQGEESRINFLKYNLEKIMKHFNSFGKAFIERAAEMQGSITMINSETDLRIFIDEHRSQTLFQNKVDFAPF